MISDSRKANRDKFASQRAHLHFASTPAGYRVLQTEDPIKLRPDLVRNGLVGFVPLATK